MPARRQTAAMGTAVAAAPSSQVAPYVVPADVTLTVPEFQVLYAVTPCLVDGLVLLDGLAVA